LNKILFSFIIVFGLNICLPYKYSPTIVNAGMITWGVKKIIGGTIGLFFKVSSEKLMEIQVEKLISYLQKHPQYKQYAINKVKEQINKHPKYKVKWYKLLNQILLKVNNVVKPKNVKIKK